MPGALDYGRRLPAAVFPRNWRTGSWRAEDRCKDKSVHWVCVNYGLSQVFLSLSLNVGLCICTFYENNVPDPHMCLGTIHPFIGVRI